MSRFKQLENPQTRFIIGQIVGSIGCILIAVGSILRSQKELPVKPIVDLKQ